MSPVHVSPGPSVRIVLEEKVVLSVVIHAAIRIVVPSSLGRKVKQPPLGLTIEIIDVFDRVALLDPCERRGVLTQFVDSQGQ